jgi:hypothetical protein
MRKYLWMICLAASIITAGCKGNGSTNGNSNAGEKDSAGINDGTGAPGSGTGSAGAGTVGDSTQTPQDTVKGAPVPKSPDTISHK